MSKPFFYTVLLILVGELQLFSQSRMDFGIKASPSISNFNTKGETDIYERIFPFNYGIYSSYLINRFSISSGLLFVNQGANLKMVLFNNISGSTGSGTAYIRIRSLCFPLVTNYLFLLRDRFSLFAGGGIYISNIYSQQIEYPWVDNSNPSIISRYPLSRFNDIEYFENVVYQLNIGVGVRKKIKENFNLVLRPNILYQLRKDLPKDKYAWTIRLSSIAIDMGLYYTFGKALN